MVGNLQVIYLETPYSVVDGDVCSLVFYSSVTLEFWHGFFAKLVLLGFVLCNVFCPCCTHETFLFISYITFIAKYICSRLWEMHGRYIIVVYADKLYN